MPAEAGKAAAARKAKQDGLRLVVEGVGGQHMRVAGLPRGLRQKPIAGAARSLL